MKLDSSTYYPKSHLDDDDDDINVNADTQPQITHGALEPDDVKSDNVESDGEDTTNRFNRLEEADSSNDSENSVETPRPGGIVTGVSNILSWVLVPLMMPVYGTILAFSLSILTFTSPSVRLTFTAIVFAINVVIPAIVFFFLKRVGIIHDVGLNEQKERLLPYIVCIICLVATAIFFHIKSAPEWLVFFYWGGAAAGVIELVINRWWKISVHAAGIAGIVALLTHLLCNEYSMPATFSWLLISVALGGLLGSARVWLGRHTTMQVLAGYAVGFLSVYIATLL